MHLPSIPVIILIACVAAAAGMMLTLTHGAGILVTIMRLFPSTRSQIMRVDRESRDAGFDPHGNLAGLVGSDGVLVTDARPVGKARLGDQTVTVVARDGFLTKGVAVRAVGFRAGNLIVSEAEGAGGTQPLPPAATTSS